ncbi:pathogenicity-like protein [Pseudoxanthomonas composti]|uniref:Pathogenicity-like protein n=1 Tax=Pseudoxanthomonas composti TaxID=2137479 RepID=A0A4Q1JU97_9GAMM|nr:pathogenicity-like protein [Pseudoxanthomonas composti]RXR05270.1 pathogenicity-like protein [Pseudoxanthomonas composti]
MRQIFSSQRVETVEGVAKLLTEAGVDVYVTNGRSYQSKRSGRFSYSDPTPSKDRPTVWVRHADDQPRARELLREAGLMESTRPDQRRSSQYAPLPTEAAPKRNWAWRIRLVLMACIAAAAIATFMRHRQAAEELRQAQALQAEQARQQRNAQPYDDGLKEGEVRIPISTPPQAPRR